MMLTDIDEKIKKLRDEYITATISRQEIIKRQMWALSKAKEIYLRKHPTQSKLDEKIL
jgi:hypothetical protein